MTTTAQQLGALTAQIEALTTRLDRDREDRKESEKQAQDSREETKRTLVSLEHGHQQIVARLDKIEPVTDMVTSWKAKIVGGVAVLGLIGGVIISALTYFKEQITGLFS